jgi:hypothetical protein
MRIPDLNFARVGAARLKRELSWAVSAVVMVLGLQVFAFALLFRRASGANAGRRAAGIGCAILLFAVGMMARRLMPAIIAVLLRPYARALQAAAIRILDGSPAQR